MDRAAHACDVIIVGAGLAGSTLALLLGRRGYTVELYEQGTFPRDKPCGEGLLPPGVDLLVDLGLLEAVGGQKLAGVRYHVGEGSVRTGFGHDSAGRPRRGLGQRRLHLDHALWKAACATRGVFGYDGTAVSAPLLEADRVRGVVVQGRARRAPLVIAADGATSMLRRKLGLERVLGPRRLGIRAHYLRPPGAPELHDIHVFLRRGYEIYVTPLPQGEVLLAALAQDQPGLNLRRSFERWRAEEPVLQQWLEGATQSSELLGRAPLLKRCGGRVPSGLVLLGDAAESIDPITAGGMSLALFNATLLARHIPGILDGCGTSHQAFAAASRRAVRIHRWLGAGLRTLGRTPLAARGVKGWIDRHPATMDSLVALAGSTAMPRSAP